MSPRIAPLDPPYDDSVAAELARLMGDAPVPPIALFRTLAHHEVLLGRFRQIGSSLLSRGQLDDAERETVIHRVTARAGAMYEWGVHAALFAPRAGFDDAWLHASVHGVPDDFADERQRLLVALCDELHDTATVSDELWAQLERQWPADQLVELLCLAGFYRLVSYLCNALRLEPEPWARTAPPR